MRTILIIVLVLAVLMLLYYFSTTGDVRIDDDAVSQGTQQSENNDTTSGLLAEENAVAMFDQRPGTSVTVAQVYLEAPGYVVIHEDNNGDAGAIIGSSALLQAGESSQVPVSLTRASVEGERLYAMIHLETDGNATFDANSDAPAPSVLGGPIMTWFEIVADADEDVEVTL